MKYNVNTNQPNLVNSNPNQNNDDKEQSSGINKD